MDLFPCMEQTQSALQGKDFHKYIIFAEKKNPHCVSEGTASITLNPCGTHPGR